MPEYVNEKIFRNNGALSSMNLVGSDFNFSSVDITADGNKVWHAVDDGSASLLDSDLLDGQQGSYFGDMANSTGTLPDARLAASTYNMSALKFFQSFGDQG